MVCYYIIQNWEYEEKKNILHFDVCVFMLLFFKVVVLFELCFKSDMPKCNNEA